MFRASKPESRFLFLPGSDPLPKDVIELRAQVRSIFNSVRDAVAQRDFAKAHEYSNEEGRAREKLQSLYQQHGLLDWLYE